MTKMDLVNNLGTVARSGTTKFLDAIQDGTADVSQIGQFGVGFYSAYLVADRVRVASKNPNDPVQHVWESKNGEDTFHIYEDPRGDTLGRGTEITLYLKEDALEYSAESKIKELASYYSEFLTHPIFVLETKTEQVPKEKPPKEEGEEEEEESLEVKEDEEEMEEEPEMEEITTQEWTSVNQNKPIWNRDKDEVKDEEYRQFFKVVSKDSYSDPASLIHFNAEGNINFKSILYLPEKVPFDFMSSHEEDRNEMKLYVKKVLISDNFELLPKYLSFVKGVVDSDDLPLNVNRETLQENKVIKIISKKLVRKVLEMIRKMADYKPNKKEDDVAEVEIDVDGNEVEPPIEEDGANDYIKWYKEFGPAMKMGAIEDNANRERILKLLRFKTSKAMGEDDWVSLQEYVDRMKDWQDQIYFIPGETIAACDDSEFMDAFKSKGVEVLYFDHPIDDYFTAHAPEFGGKRFQSITKAGVKFKDEDEDLIKRRSKAYEKKYKPLTKFLKDTFGDAISKVQISKRLGDAPAMLAAEDYGYSANMERLLKSQARAQGIDEHTYKSYRVLEINPRHPFMTKLLGMVTPEEGVDEEDFTPKQEAFDIAWLIHDTAALNSGYNLKSLQDYTRRLTRILQSQMDLDEITLEEEISPEVEEDVAEDVDDSAEGMNLDDLEFS